MNSDAPPTDLSEQTTTRRPRRRRMPLWLRIIGWMVGTVLMLVLAAAAALVMAVERTASSLPSYESMKVAPKGRTIRIHTSDGTVLQTLGPAYGEWLPHDKIPDVMRHAIVAIEDRRFETHHGVDPKSLARVVWLAWKYHGTNKRLQGASTITQQAARTVFLSQRYDVRRKLKEMLIAMAMERKLDKDHILELYLNRVYLGGGAYGIDAASRKFFGHSATTLSLSEAAMLAGLAKAPSDYAPSADPKASFGRTKVVLSVMQETGNATSAAVVAANSGMPTFTVDAPPAGNGTRYFTDWVTPQIDALAHDQIGVVDVYTTFDPKLQEIADEAVSKAVPKGAQGALVSLDADGAVRAMVGGTDYATSSYNRATQAARQPGSSFKLFVYLTALENGYRPQSTVVDAPITIGGWSPRNSTGRNVGSLPMASAFAQSINTVAARLGDAVGIPAITRTAKRFGFTTRINPDPAMVLGTSEAHLIDMTRAYASIASGGLAIAPYGISRVAVNGKEIYRHDYKGLLLVSPRVAADMTSLLRGAVAYGTGQAANIGRPVAGKTGTTSSNKDGLFLGFSSGITTGVWIGRDDAKPIDGLQGGRAPARAFAAYMRKAVTGRPFDDVAGDLAYDPGDGASPDDEGDATDVQPAKGTKPTPPPVDPQDRTEEPEREPRSDGRSRAMPMPATPSDEQ